MLVLGRVAEHAERIAARARTRSICSRSRRRKSAMPRSALDERSRVRSAIGALADPGHDVAAVDEVEDELAALVAQRHVVDRDLAPGSTRAPPARRPVARVPEVQRVRVVDGHADLEAVLAVRAHAQHQREHQRMPDPPVVVVAAAALEDAALDDAVAGSDRSRSRTWRRGSGAARGQPMRRRAHRRARWWPCSHSRWSGSTLFSMIWSQLHGMQRAADVAERAVPDEEVPARQERRGLGPEVGEDEPAQLLRAVGRASARARAARASPAPPGISRQAPPRSRTSSRGRRSGARLVDEPVAERRAPVRAALVEEPERAARRAEQDQVLAEQADASRGAAAAAPTLAATGSQ